MKELNIKTNKKVEVYFNLYEFSATKNMMWNFHVDDSSKIRYDTSLGLDPITSLGSNLKNSDHIIK